VAVAQRCKASLCTTKCHLVDYNKSRIQVLVTTVPSLMLYMQTLCHISNQLPICNQQEKVSSYFLTSSRCT
jgi:hypothetical protein